jgi:hypothetical protein
MRRCKYACLRSRYLETAVVYLPISRSLPSNGATCHNIAPPFLTSALGGGE